MLRHRYVCASKTMLPIKQYDTGCNHNVITNTRRFYSRILIYLTASPYKKVRPKSNIDTRLQLTGITYSTPHTN
ncbi:hypothetical protein CLV44_10372 [Marinobacterium halophilum]|uniref:Uncharacterized protein n=1 Tax=Marinobacterium halophilum TaxID=267374 RepID=A0A2P8F251_9GAMM|nr:hypothetical protein CLV44_10372 [Marinobacterium halophilum]